MNVTATPLQVYGTRLPTYVFDNGNDLARHVANIIAGVIRERNAFGQNAVLGLPTGSTPVGAYRELIRLHKQGLDFSRVVCFNLDEYFGISRDKLQSYHRWMHEQLFNHVNIPPENIHAPDGTVGSDAIDAYCVSFERKIQDAGGIDVMLLGIGGNGHVGFNEPFSSRNSRTRLCTLDPTTRRAAASDFYGEKNVPTHAVTMGVATILEARKVFLMALGEHKADVIRQTVEGPVTERVPASLLQDHGDAHVLLDSAAAGQLTGTATPWLLGSLEWDDKLTLRAVLWLCEQTGKALLKLDDNDFRSHNLHQLLRDHGPAQALAHRVFRWMMRTIEYHPAGRDAARVICFSPHPDDDVISMGGTLIRLNEDGHEVHVAYMTSGNIAVFDHDAQRVADLVTEYNRLFGIDEQRSTAVEDTVRESLGTKRHGVPDIDSVQQIKGLIRWSEAKAGALVVGCSEDHLHFMNMPFYRTGTIAKKPVGEEDVVLILDLIEKVKPDQIYVAGDLSDPHGTHRVCAEAIFRAIDRLEERGCETPDVLLYRGAWQEYALHELEIAVPLSPSDIEVKRKAIFMHESQKDEALFPGSDPREFWQRAEDRNKGTADHFNQIGLPEYLAMEAFVRWNGVPI
ncbi:MAG TPA: glucosamine-6-phosphate deaminase [Planctomycetes bacterium]|nr:glucosamine-6-phosphate deaminase [Planctomycetota bacterium]